MKKTTTILLLLHFAGMAFSQLNMTLLDQIDYAPNANDIWGWVDPDNGKEYALVGLVTGVSIVDVSNPSNIVEVQFIPGASSTWRDIKTWGNYAYVTNESGGGLMVIDLSGAPNNITATNWSPNILGGTLTKAHNLYIDEFGYAYIAGANSNINNGGILILDVFSTPGTPIFVGAGPSVYAHDVYARDNKMYASEIYGGKLSIYDVSDKQNVTLLASQQTPNNFTHNAWLNDAGDVVFTTDEQANAYVAAYDISDLNDIKELDRFRPIETLGSGVIPHNVHVWNDWLIISYYTDGGIIVDASRPENLIEVGDWDTFLGGSGFSGVWGAYPFLPSGIVLLTDIGTGLYVCGANYVRACWLEGKVTNAVTSAPINGVLVNIDSPQANASTSNLTGDYKTGQAIPGQFDVTFSATGYFPKTVQATLENGVLTILDVQLEPLVIPNFPQFTATTTAGCEPLSVSFSENSGLAASWLWTFENGNPATSAEQNPTVVFSTPGPHDVTLEVVTMGGNTYTKANPDLVFVDPAPVASFSQIIDSLEVTLLNSSSFYNTAQWQFGDGAGSDVINATHTFSGPGTYDVTLSITGSCGTDMVVQPVTIGPFQPTAGFSANVLAGCAPFTVEFTDQSLGFPESWAWSFPGGDPATSTEQNPTVTYSSSGTYDVQLLVTTAAGSDEILQTGYINLDSGPAAGFDFTINGPEVQFSNSSSNATTYSWAFGDGETSNQPDPAHLFQMPGTYTVVLTAANDCGTSTFSQDVTITAFLPVASFSANVLEGCAPLTVEFSDQSIGEPDGWTWTFPGGDPAISTDQNPVVTYGSPGIYNVTLVASNALGNGETTLSGFITVSDAPTAGFTFTQMGAAVVFSNTSSNADGYEWDFNDGSSTGVFEENPVHIFPGVGSYHVTLTATNQCGTVSFVETVVIDAVQPAADFSFSGNTGCAPFTVAFSDQSLDVPTTWEWSFPGGTPSASSEQNPVVVYENPGTYSVGLTVSNAAGSSQITQTDLIVVDAAPIPGFTVATNGLTAVFTNTSSNGISYLWDFGNGASSTGENPSVEYDAPGTYPVVLTVTNNCGSTVYMLDVVVEAVVPTADFSASQTEGCVPLEVQFTDESTDGPTAWEWSFPGGNPATSTEQHPVVVYDAAGVFSVELKVTNTAGSSTSLQPDLVVVDGLPTAGYIFSINDLAVNFTNTSENATAYTWDFGDNTGSSTDENPNYTYAGPGEYEVTMTATNDCGSQAFSQTVNIGANATHILDEKYYTLSAVPNPFSEHIAVQYVLSNPFKNASISVCNILGEEIARVPVKAAAGNIYLGDKIPESGVYYIRIIMDNVATEAIKIVKF
ncbi:MAG: choice-of-anchor B family protein [Saprospiraceae bacterium]